MTRRKLYKAKNIPYCEEAKLHILSGTKGARASRIREWRQQESWRSLETEATEEASSFYEAHPKVILLQQLKVLTEDVCSWLGGDLKRHLSHNAFRRNTARYCQCSSRRLQRLGATSGWYLPESEYLGSHSDLSAKSVFLPFILEKDEALPSTGFEVRFFFSISIMIVIAEDVYIFIYVCQAIRELIRVISFDKSDIL